MRSRGLGAPGRQAAALAAVLLWLAPAARAEDVSERAKVASTRARLRGAAAVKVIPGGLLSVGGRKLQFMATGAKAWRAVHDVPGDNLYRVDADDRGRVLAAWEKEPVFHLFDLRAGTDRTYPKPPVPPGYKPETEFHVESLRFAAEGRAALVYTAASVWAYDTGSRSVQAGTWIPLEGNAAPTLLFSEEGFELHASPLGIALVKPLSWRNGCGYNGCSVGTIIAVEWGSGRIVRKTLFEPRGERVDTAQIVRGANDARFALQIGSWAGKRLRRILRYAYGKEPTLLPLSVPTAADFDKALLAANDDFVEVRQAGDRSVTVLRQTAGGQESSATIAPWADQRGRPAKDWLHGVGERQGGALWLHWGDNLVVGDPKAPRKLDVGGHVGRGSEWAGAYIYDPSPETLWMGVEVGGGRDWVGIDLADADRRARPWALPTAEPGQPGPMPPAVTAHLSGSRREVGLPRGVVSIGQTDLYYRDNARQDWRLLYALPDHSIYRQDVDEKQGRILAHWSSERVVHLFEPGGGVHRTFPWPVSDVPGLQAGLSQLSFAAGGADALVYMSGLVQGRGPMVTEATLVPLDGQGAPRRLLRATGNYIDLSPRGAAFVLPTKDSGYRCDTSTCILDSVSVFSIAGDRAQEEVVYRPELYTDFARRVPGRSGDELGIVIRYSLPREAWATRGRSERALLRFRYGAPGVRKTVLPAWSVDAVKRSHLTEAGDYLEFVETDGHELVIELVGRQGARSTWRVPTPRHTGGPDDMPDRGVYGFGERAGGGYWLHWGDHIVLMRDQQPLRAYGIAGRLKARGEWAGAASYTPSPEKLRIGVDIGAGREFIDVDFATIDKKATELR